MENEILRSQPRFGYAEARLLFYRRVLVFMTTPQLIKDHLRFGYIMRVDYRPVIEGMFSDRKVVDYIIRYFPGKGAIESTKRIKSRSGKENFEQLRLNLISPLQEEAKRPYSPVKPENQKTRKEEKMELTKEEQELLAIKRGRRFGLSRNLCERIQTRQGGNLSICLLETPSKKPTEKQRKN